MNVLRSIFSKRLCSSSVIAVFLFSAFAVGGAYAAVGDTLLWGPQEMAQLRTTPKTTWVDSIGPDYSLIYESVAYQGQMAQAFAYYSVPSNVTGKIPAMVLIHGGSGGASKNWAQQWAGYGYAAIAMDLNGDNVNNGRPWDSDNFGAGEQMPLKDTWYYHAPSAVIRAVSWLRSRPEVDTTRIGMMGISWGGWTASIVAGVDKRIKFGVPVYGCGFIQEHSFWQRTQPITSPSYVKVFDPANYLPSATMPLFWVAGANDPYYPACSRRKSMRLTKGTNTLYLDQDMTHDYDTPWATPEIRQYVDALCKSGQPGLLKITALRWSADSIWVDYEKKTSGAQASSAQIIYTTAADPWTNYPQTSWLNAAATVNASQAKVTAKVPANAKVFYLLITDNNGMKVSSEHVDRTQDAATGTITYAAATAISPAQERPSKSKTASHSVIGAAHNEQTFLLNGSKVAATTLAGMGHGRIHAGVVVRMGGDGRLTKGIEYSDR